MSASKALSGADRHARTHARDKGAPPHWLRCAYMDARDLRCVKGSEHPGNHEMPKENGRGCNALH